MKKASLLFAFAFCFVTGFSQQKGTLNDPRDGKVYKTIQIGNQIWMAENLSYNAKGSCAYNYTPSATLGLLYDWKTAKKSCPTGWHLPSQAEFETLLNQFSGTGNTFKALTINGSSGFNDIGGGYCSQKVFHGIYELGCYWSSTEGEFNQAMFLLIRAAEKKVFMSSGFPDDLRSVRCVKD